MDSRLPATSRIASILAVVVVFGLASFSIEAARGAGKNSNATSNLRNALQRDLDAYLKDRSRKEHLSSLSLSVSLGKSLPSVNVTSGTTRYHGDTRATPTSLYQIGSNTKAFTAVAILQLEAQGRLSIDAPIGKYLPQFPAYRDLKLRNLLNMTSGLDSYDNTPEWERSYAKNPMKNVSADALIRLVYPRIKYSPGSKYFYSNTGYLLAQEVVSARSKTRSYDAEIARIIKTAGLKNTFYTSHLYPRAISRRVVAGYYENDDAGFGKFLGKDMSGYSLSWAQGAGAIVSTPADLGSWVRALYRGSSLLPEKQQHELRSLISVKTGKPLSRPTAKDPSGFGLGVVQRFDPKLGSFWFYQGETLGFRAAHLYFPSSDLVMSLFANSRPVESKSELRRLSSTIYATLKRTRLQR